MSKMATEHIHPAIRQTMTADWEKVGIEKPKSIFRRSSTFYGDSFVGGFHSAQLELPRPFQYFITGSSYEGFWNALCFSGTGTYFFPHGATYHGTFRDGQFHGKGTITYPIGHRLKGYWRNGKLIKKRFVFYDGLRVTEPFKYCQMPDRRFQIEFNTSLKAPGKEFLTNRQPTVDIPEGCYDTIDGYFVPGVNCIFNYDEQAILSGTVLNYTQQTDNLKRTVQLEESQFIEKNYRSSNLNPMGYRPDLYEFWLSGTAKEIDKITSAINLDNSGEVDESGTLRPSESSLEWGVDMEFEII